jgi:hypothetical protein
MAVHVPPAPALLGSHTPVKANGLLHGRWLMLARFRWFAVLGIFVLSIPPYYDYLHKIAPDADIQSGQLTESGVAAFSQAVRDKVDLGRLTGRLVEVVDETTRPTHLSLWLREPPRKA